MTSPLPMTERMHVQVIAEAGVSHNGDIGRALAMVDAAAEAGADVVKFQTFDPQMIARGDSPLAAYQAAQTTGIRTQRELLAQLQLSDKDHRRLIQRCAERRIQFLSTPFDTVSLALLQDLQVPAFKISSADLTNIPFLASVAAIGKPVILSTGMADLQEIEDALAALAWGYSRGNSLPTGLSDLQAVLRDTRANLTGKVTLLHCTSAYPAPLADVNLRAMDTLRTAFNLPVGYSDHTLGYSVAVAAAARGAILIEKHFTLDRALPGPDHAASLEPGELAAMISGIRDVEAALGSEAKQATASELGNRPLVRKSLVAAQPIRAGETFTTRNLTAKRPGDGLAPGNLWRLLGSKAARDYAQDEPIDA